MRLRKKQEVADEAPGIDPPWETPSAPVHPHPHPHPHPPSVSRKKRKKKKKGPVAKVFPASRWRVLRASANARYVEQGDVGVVMPKRLAKRMAHPRRRFRSSRGHGRQGTITKGWRW